LTVPYHQFILDPTKKGAHSAVQLLDDLSDVADRYLAEPTDDAEREASSDEMAGIRRVKRLGRGEKVSPAEKIGFRGAVAGL
jgi:hypothetical protein